jgi:inorganic pyrophosphatase
MEEVDVVIEISKNSHIKYEYDKEKNMIRCDRILHTPMKYPFNYGFIPNTLSEDGDPLDVVVLMDDKLVPGCIIRCTILGYLETKDDAGNDPKLIVCPIKKVDPMWKDMHNLFNIPEPSNGLTIIESNNIKSNIIMNLQSSSREKNNIIPKPKINSHTLMRVKYFFEHYKDLENKRVYVGNFYNKEDALKIYNESVARYRCIFIQKLKITDFFQKI